MNLLSPKLELHGIKAICIDDLIAPKKTARTSFLSRTRLYHEDVFFADAYEPALEILDTHPEISLAFIDMRIPRRSQDRHDFNPENPRQEWGKKLVEELLEKYPQKYPKREIDIIVITAYTIYNFSSREKKSSPVRIRARYKKPVDYDSLIKDIAFVVKNRREKTFDYALLDEELSSFVREKTEEIKRLTRKLVEDIINIGRYLIEVKARLKYGQFYNWIERELGLSSASVTRFMQAASSFKLEELKGLDIVPSALYELAATSVPEEAAKEAIKRAKQGEKIDLNTAKAIRAKYQADKKGDKSEQSVDIYSLSREKEEKQRLLSASASQPSSGLPEKKDKTKQSILAIVPSENAVKNSWWQLGEHNKLFCGEPKSHEFLKRLPKDIGLSITFLPENDFLVPPIEAIFSCAFRAKYEDIELDSAIETLIEKTTKSGEIVVFNHLYYIELLEVTEKLKCHFIVAEPDLSKCEKILTFWRKKGSVSRIKN